MLNATVNAKNFIADLDKYIASFKIRINSALNQSAKIIAEEEAKRTKGKLAKSFESKNNSGVSGRDVVSKKDYATYIENGRPGIVAAPGKILRFTLSNGQTLFRKSVGPAKAQPFVEQSKQAAISRIQEVFNDYLKIG